MANDDLATPKIIDNYRHVLKTTTNVNKHLNLSKLISSDSGESYVGYSFQRWLGGAYRQRILGGFLTNFSILGGFGIPPRPPL